MAEFLMSILGPLLGGVISATVGLLLFHYKRKQDTMDDFLALLAEQRSRLVALELANRQSLTTERFFNPGEDEFFTASIPVLSLAVDKVRRVLPPTQAANLRAIFADYSTYRTKYEGMTRAALGVEPGKSYAQKLLEFLDRMEAIVSRR